MNIYFGRAEQCEFDLGDTFEVYRNNKIEHYYHAVEFGTNAGGLEEVCIHDTCGRSIPISVDTIPHLVEALLHCFNLQERLNTAQEAIERAETNTIAISENDEWRGQNVNYID